MDAVKKGMIPRKAPLVKRCTRVNSLIYSHTSRITQRNLAEMKLSGRSNVSQVQDYWYSYLHSKIGGFR